MNLEYVISGNVDVHKIDDLRLSVGWNSMAGYYQKSYPILIFIFAATIIPI